MSLDITTTWHLQVPTSELFRAHATLHTSRRFLDGRTAGLWLLRPKLLPEGWNHMSPAQRARTGARSARVLGFYPTVVEVFANVDASWHYYQPDRLRGGLPETLSVYDWCPLTTRGDPVPFGAYASVLNLDATKEQRR